MATPALLRSSVMLFVVSCLHCMSARAAKAQQLPTKPAPSPEDSIAYYASGLATGTLDSTSWQLRVRYAAALNAGAFQAIERLGLRGPEQSMSLHRIALVREAHRQLAVAESLARTPQAVAIVRCAEGELLAIWGFPLDAYGRFRSALQADPHSAEAASGILYTRSLLTSPGTMR